MCRYTYVVCSVCHSMFLYEQFLEKVGSHTVSKRCPRIHFSHPSNNLLLKHIFSNSGTGNYTPLMCTTTRGNCCLELDLPICVKV